jgi:long-chain acyl-CoA synthetase
VNETAAAKPITRKDAIASLTTVGQPYEIEQQLIRGVPQRVFKNAPASLRVLFEQTVSDKPFIVFADERMTFAETYRDAAKIAHLMVHEYGVKKGDRVAISMRNYPEWIKVFTATTSIGAIAVALNALWQPDELEYGLKNCGAKLLFADQERLDRFEKVSAPLDVQVIGVRSTRPLPGTPDLQTLLAGIGDVEMPAADVLPEDPAIIFYTSGSTGHPKGVVSTHRSVLSALFSWELDLEVGARLAGIEPVEPTIQPTTLLAVPLFHVTGSHAVYLMSYRAQQKIVSMYKWDPEQAAALIEHEAVTSFIAPSAMTGDLVREAKRTQRDLSTLTRVGGGGAPRPPEQVAQIETAFTQALPATGWGMTETNAIGAGIGGPDYLAHPLSSGRCSAVLELKVVDETGVGLPNGRRGELLIRGTSMFVGYWNRPELNAEVFTDGWFRTGDVAYLDDEGYLFIVDRIKDLIIRGGENIGCGQVEAALLKFPGIHEVAVYGMPDERLGEEVGATVYGEASLDVAALREFLNGHLARFEVPRYIRVTQTALPRTASGKILKRELRDEAVRALAAPNIRS